MASTLYRLQATTLYTKSNPKLLNMCITFIKRYTTEREISSSKGYTLFPLFHLHKSYILKYDTETGCVFILHTQFKKANKYKNNIIGMLCAKKQ